MLIICYICLYLLYRYSARHGLRRHQFDLTWLLISALQKVGLVTNVKLPTEAAKDRLRIAPA